MHADIFRAYVRKMLRDEDEKKKLFDGAFKREKFKSEGE